MLYMAHNTDLVRIGKCVKVIWPYFRPPLWTGGAGGGGGGKKKGAGKKGRGRK